MITNKSTKQYDVVWIVNGKEKEIIEYNKPVAVAKSLAKTYGNTTYRTGKVIARPQN